MPKLTKRTVEALPVKSENYFTWDAEVKGFGVRVSAINDRGPLKGSGL